MGIQLAIGILGFFFVMASSTVQAQKTDTIRFYNGEHIRCEIKYLALGKLSISTVNMGTVSIKFEKVAFIESPTIFEIRFKNHLKLYGILSKGPEPGTAMVYSPNREMKVNLIEIVSLTPIKQKFFDKVDGNFDLGLSYVKGSNNFQFNYDLKVKYREKKYKNEIYANALITRNSATETVKQEGGNTFSWYLKRTQFLVFAGLWQQNSELGVQNRVMFIASYGLSPVESNFNVLSISAGLVSNNEESAEGNVTSNLESNLRIGYDLFHFSDPEIIINAYVSTFASLSEWGRIRLDNQINAKYEIFSDFYFNITYYNNYDSNPISESASVFDYGITAGIGYKF